MLRNARFLASLVLLAWSLTVAAPSARAGGGDDYRERCRALFQAIGAKVPEGDRIAAEVPLQVKATLAELVHEAGLPAVRPIGSLDQAIDYVLEEGKPILIRSEHPQDYLGLSGMVESHALTPQVLQVAIGLRLEDELRPHSFEREVLAPAIRAYLRDRETLGRSAAERALWNALNDSDYKSWDGRTNRERLKHVIGEVHGDVLGPDGEGYLKDTSYTYWPLLPGNNRSVVADSAVPGRFHVFTRVDPLYDHGVPQFNWLVVEDGVVVSTAGSDLPEALAATTLQAIELYQGVRALPVFGPSSLPIIEMQTVEGRTFFLQAHQMAPPQAATHRLDRPAEPGELEAIFVRGATPPEGIEVEVAWRRRQFGPLLDHEGQIGFSAGIESRYGEGVARRRRLRVILMDKARQSGIYFDQFRLSGGHFAYSDLFKPEVSLHLDVEQFEAEMKNLGVDPMGQRRELVVVRMRVVSDGRRALVKALGTRIVDEDPQD